MTHQPTHSDSFAAASQPSAHSKGKAARPPNPDRAGSLSPALLQAIGKAIGNRWPSASWCDLHVALAVSGGADSVALLRATLALKQHHGGAGRVFVLHVNHHLRAEESDQDQAWLEAQCRGMGAELTVLHADGGQLVESQAESIEAAARQARYALLTEAAENLGARFLATGHTQDDQVETVLFRALRGSGMRGMRGIPAARPLTESLTLVRPLLGCRRTELVGFLDSLGQAYRSDSSNQDTRHTRNRIRHDLLPLLRENYNADVEGALLRLAQQAEEAGQCLDKIASDLLAQCDVSAQGSALSLKVGPLLQQPPYLVCETLRLAWRQAGLPEQAMTYDGWVALASLALSEPPLASLNLPGSVHATREGSRLLLAPSIS